MEVMLQKRTIPMNFPFDKCLGHTDLIYIRDTSAGYGGTLGKVIL